MSEAAKIIETSGKAVEFREEPGIYSCLMTHELKATLAEFKWSGPKMTRVQWDELMAFFKWTYDTEKSEAQARMFVHPQNGWKLWAFPQKGGTGMTTKEIENEDFAAQRAAIGDGYIAFGTVHHHCSTGAFQSGVDSHDEKNVDGLHITVGKMDKDIFDIHCRLYHRGHKFEPHMDSFWDVGDVSEKMGWLASLNYNIEQVLDREARHQMCIPPLAGVTFPEQWKTNYILPVRVVSTYGLGGTWCWHCQEHAGHHPDQCTEKKVETNGTKKDRRKGKGKGNGKQETVYHPPGGHNDWWEEKTREEMWALVEQFGMTDIDFGEIITFLGGEEAHPIIEKLIDLAGDNYMKMSDLYKMALEEWTNPTTETTEDAKEAALEAKEKADRIAALDNESLAIWRGQTGCD